MEFCIFLEGLLIFFLHERPEAGAVVKVDAMAEFVKNDVVREFMWQEHKFAVEAEQATHGKAAPTAFLHAQSETGITQLMQAGEPIQAFIQVLFGVGFDAQTQSFRELSMGSAGQRPGGLPATGH